MNGGSGESPANDARIGILLRQAGQRAEPSPGMMRDVAAVVHSEWREMLAQQRRMQRFQPLWIVAKLLCVAVIALIAVNWVDAMREPSATITSIQGELQTGSDGQDTWTPGRLDQHLALGQTLRTGRASRASLNFDHGVSVRLGANTTVSLKDSHSLRLLDGAILVVVPDKQHSGPVLIQTSAGVLRSFGSSYELRAHGQVIDVSVRDGRVEIANQSGRNWAAAGQRIVVNAIGDVHRLHASTLDLDWF